MNTYCLTLQADDFTQSLKSANLFLLKEVHDEADVVSVCLELSDSGQELFVMACDRIAFYRRTLKPLENADGTDVNLPQVITEQSESVPRRLILLPQNVVTNILSMLPRKLAYKSSIQIQITEDVDRKELDVVFSYMSAQTFKFSITKHDYFSQETIQKWLRPETGSLDSIYLGLPQLKRVVTALGKTDNIRMTVAVDGHSIRFHCDALNTSIVVAMCYVENNSTNSD